MNPISLQLWTLNDNTAKDFAGTVQEVAKIGYKAVELAGTGNLQPAEAAQAVAAAGLQVSGMHTGWDQLTEKFDEVVENAARFKTVEIILSWMDKEHFSSRATCLAFGEKLGQLGAKFRAAGLKLSYHNHDQEFAVYEGRPALEWMLEACSPQDVSAQVDLFWVAAAGQDPLKAVTRLGTRARMLHLKDGIGKKQTDLGTGKVDFPAIFKLVEANDLAEWYIVEQEEFLVSRLESVRVAFAYLRSLGKA
jgi:sugar phosphate isomerase/epimerase